MLKWLLFAADTSAMHGTEYSAAVSALYPLWITSWTGRVLVYLIDLRRSLIGRCVVNVVDIRQKPTGYTAY